MPVANKPKLNQSQLDYALRCEKLLRKAQSKFGRAAVAHRLGITMSCLSKHLNGQTTTIEQWEASLATNDAAVKSRQWRRKKYKQANTYRGIGEHHNNLDGYVRTSHTNSER